jgi:HEAT repeat protein
MAIFGPPDFEKLQRNRDWPRLIYWALLDKEPDLRRQALKVLRDDVYQVVEYLYETAMWAEENSVGRRKRLPAHGVRRLNEAVSALARVGSAAVGPLVASVQTYDEYGRSEENARALYLALAFDILMKIGPRAVDGLRELAKDPHEDVRESAREVLGKLDARGLLDR